MGKWSPDFTCPLGLLNVNCHFGAPKRNHFLSEPISVVRYATAFVESSNYIHNIDVIFCPVCQDMLLLILGLCVLEKGSLMLYRSGCIY